MAFRLLLLAFIAALIYRYLKSRRQQEQFYYLNHYQFPSGIRRRLALKYPELNDEQWALVAKAMRQYFRLHRYSKRATLAMPSRIVDDFWHEFILHTAVYQEFCQKALGRFIHHTPAESTVESKSVRRAWDLACRDEGLRAGQIDRLPLLFAIDSQLQIPEGFLYSATAFQNQNKDSSSCSGGSCGSGADCNSSDCGDSGSSCGSGCGGGGD
ncbi:hypothetical protein HQ393_13550 [Chitinibacter bivalviorum]|uniref:Glycine-rich domain-containing protein-like n=1 Tax=Chitinibacter bivalviorum TaxID=2739434 RepID=A0A7H9BKI1_9NEIS|nr:hypothetical protein [Chitinibacter bivalviorum]QLG89185.1 hypothetical protein HQ393_13550 [Chitinibacter bivalviorum]